MLVYLLYKGLFCSLPVMVFLPFYIFYKFKSRILDRRHPKYGLTKWIKLVTAIMALHNFIRNLHREDHDFLQWQNTEEYRVDDDDEEEEEEEEGEEEEEHVAYEPTGDRAMEALRDNITNECNRGRLPY